MEIKDYRPFIQQGTQVKDFHPIFYPFGKFIFHFILQDLFFVLPFILFMKNLNMPDSKPRVIKDFEKLEGDIQEQVKLAYPYGFFESLIHYSDKEGKRVSALPFETDEKYYLIRMTRDEAREIIRQDEDFDDDGNLKDDVKDDYENKYSDVDYMSDYMSDDSGDDDNDDY